MCFYSFFYLLKLQQKKKELLKLSGPIPLAIGESLIQKYFKKKNSQHYKSEWNWKTFLQTLRIPSLR